jgi:hypothetical protein
MVTGGNFNETCKLNGENMSHDLTGQSLTLTQGKVIPWHSYSYAGYWYKDALAEANRIASNVSDMRNARRREIVFAVCAAESHLLEWVRDDVLKSDYDTLVTYFPQTGWRGIKDRWKEVTKKLEQDGRIRRSQDFTTDTWSNFTILVDRRNDLVHGSVSKPINTSNGVLPGASTNILDTIPAGWSVGVVNRLISELHVAANCPAPAWL